jgi:RNA polymerase-interacting CarD/CdnL/TRCF family regulator
MSSRNREQAASATGEAAAAAGEAAAAAGEAAAAAFAAAAAAQQQVAPTYEFSDLTSNATIISRIRDISIQESDKRLALKNLSAPKLCSLVSDPSLSAGDKTAIIDLLDYGGISKILFSSEPIPEDILAELHRRMKAFLQGSRMRRRGSATDLASKTKELFATVNPGDRDTCFFKPVNLKTLVGMCRTFPVLNFMTLSQHTLLKSVHSEEAAAELDVTEPVGIITLFVPLTGRGGHFNAYIRAGTTWYNADNSHAVLRERTHGQPTWKTVPPKPKQKMAAMIYCYADTSKIPNISGQYAPGSLHGHPTFAQDGMGSCSVDALASVLCFADGFRDIISAAMGGGIETIVLRHMGHARERIDNVPKCLEEVETLISRNVATLSGPTFTKYRPPPQENILRVSTAPEGSMFFSTEYHAPSSELITRMIQYLAGTAIRYYSIRVEAGLGYVPVTKNTTWGLRSRRVSGLKSLALSRVLKASTRRKTPRKSSARSGMAVKATKKRRSSSVNRLALYRATVKRNRSRSKHRRQQTMINAKRGMLHRATAAARNKSRKDVKHQHMTKEKRSLNHANRISLARAKATANRARSKKMRQQNKISAKRR